MGGDPLHERMAEYERLADAVSGAVTEDRVNIQPAGRSADGQRYRFAARLDRAALIAALTDALPARFGISHVNDDGSLSVEWTGKREAPSRRTWRSSQTDHRRGDGHRRGRPDRVGLDSGARKNAQWGRYYRFARSETTVSDIT